MTPLTDDDFTAVTTDSRRKRHWARSRHLSQAAPRGWSSRPGRSGYALCAGYGCMDQERLDAELSRWPGTKPVTIADLPPCKQCDKSKARRIAGRPS